METRYEVEKVVGRATGRLDGYAIMRCRGFQRTMVEMVHATEGADPDRVLKEAEDRAGALQARAEERRRRPA